ncbi:MAG: nuclear transport factor 2 family protein [Gammaproteobacteria bacterium]
MQLTEVMEPARAESADLARRVQKTYENLSLERLVLLREIYTEDVCFEDPAHGIQGLDALTAYFRKLYANVEQCRFKFHRSVVSSEGLFFSWTMILRHRHLKRGQFIRVEGASYLKVRDGKVYYHRDYFDLGAMVYENIPLLGSIVRLVRSRIAG